VLADVHNPFLSLRLDGVGWLGWKLKHCRCLTFRQVRQKLNVPIREFQRIVVRAWLAFVDLPKDGRSVLDCFHFTAKQANPRALWLLIEGEFSARKNTNCGPRILRCGEPSSSCVEVAGDQAVADLSWPRLGSIQAVVADVRRSLPFSAPLRRTIEEGANGKKKAYTQNGGVGYQTLSAQPV
jgi:hypothetical protein